MGYFTFTYANRKPVEAEFGYTSRSKLPYGASQIFVAVPDGSFIECSYYNGYGMFNSHDIYELVVDWNKDDLIRLFNEFGSKHFGKGLLPIVEEFVLHGEEAAQALADKTYTNCLRTEWKRNIGIAISCEDKDHEKLKYPIKISFVKKNYHKLKYISYATQ